MIKAPDDEIWKSVEGIDFNGPTTLASLVELSSIEMAADERNEILANLCRDGWASSAAYPALPVLLAGHPENPEVSLEMAWTAGMILSLGKDRAAQLRSDLSQFVTEEVLKTAIRRILHLTAENDPDDGLLLASFAWIMDLRGRQDLAEGLWAALTREARKESALLTSGPSGLMWHSSLNSPSFLNGHEVTSSGEA